MIFSYLFSKLIKKVYLPAIKKSEIDKTSSICSGAHVVESSVDKFSYVGNYCTVINTKIGKFCSIADNCIIGGANHPINWVSTSPVFHQGRNILKRHFSNHEFESSIRTNIGSDVWIGNNCLIKGGITINHGAVIGMGSVLTKDVGPYEIWAGNPARLIKKRFSNEVIEFLIENEWWNLEEPSLYEHAKTFNNIDEYINIYMRTNR